MGRKMHTVRFNAALNVIKQLCSVIFPLITVPYVSRILHKANYGKISFGSSIISYFSLIASLGIAVYAIREGAKIRDDKEKFSSFVNEMFTINIVSTLVSYILLLITLIFIHKEPGVREVILVQSIVIICTTLGLDWINTIYEDFTYLTIRYIVVQAIAMALMFIFVHKAGDYILYAGISTFATAGANIFNIFYIRRYVKPHLTRLSSTKKHLKRIFILFANNIATTVYINSDITIMGIYRSQAEVGIYGFATKIYFTIVMLLNSIVSAVMPRLAYLKGQDDHKGYRNLCQNTLDSILLLLLPAVTGLSMMSNGIIELLGGNEYLPGSAAMKILSVSLLFAVLANYYSSCILIVNKQEKYILWATAAGASLNVILNFILIPHFSFYAAALTTLLSEITVFTICFIYSCRITVIVPGSKNLISVIAGCLCIYAVCYACNRFIGNAIIRVISAIIISATLYAAVLIASKNALALDFINSIRQKAVGR